MRRSNQPRNIRKVLDLLAIDCNDYITGLYACFVCRTALNHLRNHRITDISAYEIE